MSIELNDKIVNYEALDVFRQILVGQLTDASSESIKTALQAKLGDLGNYTVEQIVGTPIEVQMPDGTYVVSLKQLLGAEVKRAKAAEATLTNDVSSLGTRMSTAESYIASNKNMPVSDLYERLGYGMQLKRDDKKIYQISFEDRPERKYKLTKSEEDGI